jgi:23S rRNA (uracil1939-C5)-methyltransferase
LAETPRVLRLTIDTLGHRGDGIAQGPEGPVHVPFALSGETVTAEIEGGRGRLVAIEVASPQRVDPACPLFGRCGGCATQHLAHEAALGWKRDLVAAALRQAGVEAPVNPTLDAHGAGRRRVIFHAVRSGRESLVGFMEARSHRLVPVEACPVLAPGLAGAPAVARRLATVLAGRGKPLDIHATATDSGLDVDIRGHGEPSRAETLALSAAADALDLARLSVHGTVVIERRPPLLSVGRAVLSPPPGGFLQATAEGEELLARLAGEAVAGARRIADLFSGAGVFALRLAESAHVAAFDSSAPAIAALMRAARAATGALRPVEAQARDLFRRPLLPQELKPFEAVVIDPPRQGALEQARALAASKVARIAYISCNAGTFARDAALLIAGGYRLVGVTPVDQFRHSAHVELVGTFTR